MAEENKKQEENVEQPRKEVEKPVEKVVEKKEQDSKKQSEVEKKFKPTIEKAMGGKGKSGKTAEVKVEFEREYIIPLRKKVQKVPRYKRAKRAIKVIKEFLARHMKVEDRDLRKVKIDKYLNQEIWFRGIKKPPAKIKVKVRKMSNGIVISELAEIPEKVKWDIKREEKKKQAEGKIKKPGKVKRKVEEEKPETPEEKKETEEKEKASVESGLKNQKQQAKDIKHTVKAKQEQKHRVRKALKK